MSLKYFSYTTNQIVFNDNTLILPALTLGNVGQLAIDLFISTFNFKKVGYLESPYVVPFLGNDALGRENNGLVSTALEVFQHPQKKITLIQQRSPVIKGHYGSFCNELTSWIADNLFKETIFLVSADASHRVDSQLIGSQFRYYSVLSNEANQHIATLGWKPLEEVSVETAFRKGTVVQQLQQSCKDKSLPLLVLVLFCAEGNNIPESMTMATIVNQYVGVAEANQTIQWQTPFSWVQLEQKESMLDDFSSSIF